MPNRTKTTRKRKRLIRLWMKDNRCNWCSQPTSLICRTDMHNKGPQKIKIYPFEATIDHLRSKFDEARKELPKDDNDIRTVLSCWKCNNDRSRKEQKNIPVEILHKKAHEKHKGFVADWNASPS